MSFYGQNGSGKTSVLEASSFAGNWAFFSNPYSEKTIFKIIALTLSSLRSLQQTVLVCKKCSPAEQVIKVNGDLVRTQGQFAKILPLQLIDPQSTDIIDHGAKPRRQLLDWLMFHVELGVFPCMAILCTGIKTAEYVC